MRLPCTCDFHGSWCSLRAGEFPRKEPRGSLHAAGCSQGVGIERLTARRRLAVATRPLPGGRADLGSLGVSCGSGLLVCLGDRRTRYGLVWQGPSRDAPGHVTPTMQPHAIGLYTGDMCPILVRTGEKMRLAFSESWRRIWATLRTVLRRNTPRNAWASSPGRLERHGRSSHERVPPTRHRCMSAPQTL